MPKAKTPIPIGDIYNKVAEEYSFEDRVWLLEELKENVKEEATLIKEKGDVASKVLNSLENGNA